MSHDAYFSSLQYMLTDSGIAEPALVLDLAALNYNLAHIKKTAPYGKRLRIVAKSLPCIALLKHIASTLGIHHLMVFHASHIPVLLKTFTNCDLLLGKPMPHIAVVHFLQQRIKMRSEQAIHWLIDTPERLAQYLAIAKQYQQCLSVNIEIDVGLHRGGVTGTQILTQMLHTIAIHPNYLNLHGLMGYDAHIEKIPRLLGSAKQHFSRSQQQYHQFIENCFGTNASARYCFNGAGSLSIAHHFKHTVCNDLSLGSLFVKPTDCDINMLDALKPALYIAAPILKLNHQPKIPGIAHSQYFSQHKGYFIYGGKWMVNPCSPTGFTHHPLYGSSSNQDYWVTRKALQLNVDDFMFFRPTQSEAVISQFAYLTIVHGNTIEHWPTFPS